MRQPKGVRYGGRKKGTPNKSTADIKALAQKHTPEAIKTLVDLMRGAEAEAARVAACKELLDRGHGKSVQFSEAKIEHRTVARIPMPAETAQEWTEQHAPERAVH